MNPTEKQIVKARELLANNPSMHTVVFPVYIPPVPRKVRLRRTLVDRLLLRTRTWTDPGEPLMRQVEVTRDTLAATQEQKP